MTLHYFTLPADWQREPANTHPPHTARSDYPYVQLAEDMQTDERAFAGRTEATSFWAASCGLGI